jgi:RNA polymerase sigma-70 factor (ECF subfamily)
VEPKQAKGSSGGFVSKAVEAEQRRDALARDIALAGEGDRAAFERVYARTSAKIYSLLLAMLEHQAVAEDVLQETFFAVWQNAGRYQRTTASPMTWLITTARNKAIDRLRSEKGARLHVALDDAPAPIVDTQPLALAMLETISDHQRLHACMEELDARQRDSIREAFFHGLTYDELAAKTGVPLGTMKSWIRRGLLRLKACLTS